MKRIEIGLFLGLSFFVCCAESPEFFSLESGSSDGDGDGDTGSSSSDGDGDADTETETFIEYQPYSMGTYEQAKTLCKSLGGSIPTWDQYLSYDLCGLCPTVCDPRCCDCRGCYQRYPGPGPDQWWSKEKIRGWTSSGDPYQHASYDGQTGSCVFPKTADKVMSISCLLKRKKP